MCWLCLLAQVLSCVNLSVGGFSMDTLQPAFSQGTLLSVDIEASVAVVRVEDSFPLPLATAAAEGGSPIFNDTCPDGSSGVCGEVKTIFWDAASARMLFGQPMNEPIDTTLTRCAGPSIRTTASWSLRRPPLTTAR